MAAGWPAWGGQVAASGTGKRIWTAERPMLTGLRAWLAVAGRCGTEGPAPGFGC